jgi:GT2 family glycosyltransferase
VAFGKLFGFPKSAIDTYYATHLNENEIGKIEILTGAFMLLKKTVYQEVKGFDEDYFMYGEDIDLSYKIIKKGYPNYYFGKAKIIHYKGESTTKDKKYIKRFYGAMEIFYKKHFKVNPISSLFMLTGIKFWQTVKSLSINAKPKNSQQKANRIIYIGKNDATFAKIKTKIQLELAIFHQDISIKDILANKPNKLIFDINYLDYKTVFSVMEKLKKQPISFRFIPKSTNYIIGSDSNNAKGEVIVLD